MYADGKFVFSAISVSFFNLMKPDKDIVLPRHYLVDTFMAVAKYTTLYNAPNMTVGKNKTGYIAVYNPESSRDFIGLPTKHTVTRYKTIENFIISLIRKGLLVPTKN